MANTPHLKKTTLNKYLKSLNDIKDMLDKNNYDALSKVFRSKKMSTNWIGVLINNNIIYRNQLGYYKWNDKIPVSYKVIEKYKDHNYKVRDIRINKLKQQPTLFDKPKTSKTRNVLFPIKDKPKEQIGLIRKFLRWIY